ncbi:hypothetical protein [Priestia megaterium]|uniref:hypothetical protein n=1 Tax=Priestia megaterium TaxID=1404 RepID=UPI001A94A305|nr:hypothetical protein [Priestia megaterium]QSX23936.1 hypothetical protein J0P05_29920 [Priestia megaterium]
MASSSIKTTSVTKNTIGNILGVLSIIIALTMTLLIVNFLSGFIEIKDLQGLPILVPAFVAPFSAACGIIGYFLNRGKISLFGIIFNIILFLVPFVYMILGTLFLGV